MRWSIYPQISAPTAAFIACQDPQVSQARHDNCQGCLLCRWPLPLSCLWAWSVYWWLSWTDSTGRGSSKLVPKVSHWFSPILFIHYESFWFTKLGLICSPGLTASKIFNNFLSLLIPLIDTRQTHCCRRYVTWINVANQITIWYEDFCSWLTIDS